MYNHRINNKSSQPGHFPHEQENNQAKAGQCLLQDQQMEEQTYWGTNLDIAQQVKRVEERNQTFKKRPSFQENIVNDHLILMKRVLEVNGLEVKNLQLPTNDNKFQKERQTKQIYVIDNNAYLTEKQKREVKELVLANQQNFSILMRLTTLFQQNKEELAYLLSKIIHYTSTSINCRSHERQKVDIAQIMECSKSKIIKMILSQEGEATWPFSKVDEEPLLQIVQAWLYHIICIKNGAYDNDGATQFLD